METAVALTCVGALTVGAALFSERIRRAWASGPLLAVALGAAVGPSGLALVDPRAWEHPERVLEHVAGVTLTVVVIGVPIRLPHRYFLARWRSVAAVIVLGMIGMWMAAALAARTALGIPWALAALIGAVLAPTDPILAGAIVEGPVAERCIPARLRHLLLAESAANDGLAWPFVMLPLLVLASGVDSTAARWADDGLLRGIVVATLLGAATGWLASKGEKIAVAKEWTAKGPLLSMIIALAIALVGLCELLHANGVFAALVAGLALDASRDPIEEHEQEVQHALIDLFQAPVFLLFGAMLPWPEWRALGLGGALFLTLLLALRRLPIVLAMKPIVAPLRTWRDAAFHGWFGPMGVAAIYYALVARGRTGEELVWTVASLAIAASVLVHGVTAHPLTVALGRRVAADTDERSGPREPDPEDASPARAG